jgi:hypothetical protein
MLDTIGAEASSRHPTRVETGPTLVDGAIDRRRWSRSPARRTVGHVSAPEYQSLLPSVLLGDPEEGRSRKRSTRDWLVDVTAFLIAVIVGGGIFADSVTQDPAPAIIVADVVAGVAAIIALWWRRRWPVGIAVGIAVAGTFSTLASVAGLIALFTVAVHRPFRTVAAVASLGVLVVPIYAAVRSPENSFVVEVLFGLLLSVAVIAWGMFVRARRQLVLSLRERAQRAESEQALRVEQARRM